MNKTFVSAVSIALTLGVVTPAFAYVSQGTATPVGVSLLQETRDVSTISKPSRRHVRLAARNRAVLQEMEANGERSGDVDQTKTTHLDRTTRMVMLRRFNRQPKLGADRYRVLYVDTNVFSASTLPPAIVQTGRGSYDRPTRRDIRENAYFGNVNDRERNILQEMEENSR